MAACGGPLPSKFDRHRSRSTTYVEPSKERNSGGATGKKSAGGRARRLALRVRSISLERQREDPCHKAVEVDARRLGGLWQQARLGQSGDRIRLEHIQLTGALLDHEVDPAERLEAQ